VIAQVVLFNTRPAGSAAGVPVTEHDVTVPVTVAACVTATPTVSTKVEGE